VAALRSARARRHPNTASGRLAQAHKYGHTPRPLWMQAGVWVKKCGLKQDWS